MFCEKHFWRIFAPAARQFRQPPASYASRPPVTRASCLPASCALPSIFDAQASLFCSPSERPFKSPRGEAETASFPITLQIYTLLFIYANKSLFFSFLIYSFIHSYISLCFYFSILIFLCSYILLF